MMMMEAKLCVAVFALLFVYTESAANATSNTSVHSSTAADLTTVPPSPSPTASNRTSEWKSITTMEEYNHNGDVVTNISIATATPAAPKTQTPTSNETSDDSRFSSTRVSWSNSTQSETSSPTSAPTPEPNATASTTSGLFSNSTSDTSSISGTTSQPSTNASQPTVGSAKPLPSTTVGPPSSTSTQAMNPSQLSVDGDKAQDSPALDPLLAGLVSAFVVAAVVITLLLFLKFRRRDSGPQFRRLQDLPMDDMMEETPLSMYSY